MTTSALDLRALVLARDELLRSDLASGRPFL